MTNKTIIKTELPRGFYERAWKLRPYAIHFCLDDLDKKKHRDVINSLKNSFF